MKHPGASFEVGDFVQIADQGALTEFARSWKLHHPLQTEQIAFARHVARVSEVRMYHGGYILYVLEGVPGIWHQCLVAMPS